MPIDLDAASQTLIRQPALTARSCSRRSICSSLELGKEQNACNPSRENA